MKKFWLAAFLIFALAFTSHAQSDRPLLLQQPTVSRSQIAFAYAGELWTVSRDGGDAIRITSAPGVKSEPKFSPDGKWIAFTGTYDTNTDVYVVPATGGEPRRLTYHPGPDNVVGWTPDGRNILFTSARDSYAAFLRLYTIALDGVFPTQLPLPLAYDGSYSTDSSHIAYRPMAFGHGNWKRYRGGMTTPIWIANLADSSVVAIPRDNSNDSGAMWIGDTIYFLSDRDGTVTLYSYDTKSKKNTQLIPNRGFDIKSASAGPGAIIYEQFGEIRLYDLTSRKDHKVDIRVTGELPEVRPHFDSVAKHILSANISPTGARAVFEAHGEVLTVPAEKGDVRNITNSPGIADRTPSWSPDGEWIAYFSDESGEYALHLRDQNGMGEVRKINLGTPPSYFYDPIWSPDSKKITYTDKRLNLWYVDLDKGAPVKIDTDTYDTPVRDVDPSWAPDSRWITYTKMMPNHMRVVFVYSLESGKSTAITDGMSDAEFAVFDKNGKSLYFTASTNIGPTTGWLDMSSYDHTVTRSPYVVVLRKDLPSPLAPESDEEKVKDADKADQSDKKDDSAEKKEEKKDDKKDEKKDAKKSDEPAPVSIDFENIGQRVLALPIPARDYVAMEAGKSGELYLLEAPPGPGGPGPRPLVLYKFDLAKRKTDTFVSGIQGFDISFNGEKILFAQAGHWAIVPTAAPPKPGDGVLKLEQMEVWVDPRAEWKQMYHEVWRIERDYLYAPNLHGVNLPVTEKKYAQFLDGIGSRNDLNYLFREMLGQINIGHMFVGGGDVPEMPPVKVGLLGADYSVENGRYRFSRVYNGENWNPQFHAPLTQPGVNIKAGEYLLAINGRELHSTENIFSFFQETEGKQIVLKVGPNPDGSASREVTVVPVDNEINLRNRAWIEDNLRKVDQMSGGKVAYVYLPNTAGGGFTNFNRYYFAQVGKQGAVIDERFNSGGSIADYIIEYMQRKLWSYWASREGEVFTSPLDSIYGAKVMIVNEYAGSGGDAMPWYFKHEGVGKLVGKRTWGGLVGIYGYPQLIDGGFVTAPRVAFFNPEGQWDVENHGTDPDIEVEFDPHAWREGHDPQLEKSVQVVLEELKKNPPPNLTPKPPPYPDYSKDR